MTKTLAAVVLCLALATPAAAQTHLDVEAIARLLATRVRHYFNPPPADLVSGKTRVRDPQTLAFPHATVRLHGIAAPSLRRTCRRAGRTPYPCGRQAAHQLSRRTAGVYLTCRIVAAGQPPGARCRTPSGADVAAWLVRHGYARAIDPIYQAAEIRARRHASGFWAHGAAAFPHPPDAPLTPVPPPL